MTDNPTYEVRALTRAFAILELVQDSAGGITSHDVVAGGSLSKPTAFRMPRNLEHGELVERVPGTDAYRLGLRCVGLGQAYLQQVDFRRESLPVLERLRDSYKETVHLAVLDGNLRVVYLEKLEGAHAVGIMMSAVGRSAPSYCTGLGKALLAARDDDPTSVLQESWELQPKTPSTISPPDDLREEFRRIRARGYALDLGEHEPGVRCVAATIRGSSGEVVAALSIAGPAERMPEELLTGELARAAMQAAREISRRLGAPEERGGE